MSYMHSIYNPKKHSIYKPKNVKKYVGKNLPIIRSGLERAFCRILDNDPKIIEWNSESFFISYMLNGKKHKYFPDFFVKIQLPMGTEEIWIVEIKSSKEAVPPTITKKKNWQKNIAKWQAAKRYCDKLGYKFKIITEKTLFR